MRLYFLVSSCLVSHCSLWGYSPINEMCNGKCASFICSSSSPSSSCSFASSDIFLFRKISSKIYMYIQFLAATLYPSLSRLTHIQVAATGSGSFFPSLSLSPRLVSFSLLLSKFFPPTCAFFSSFLVYLWCPEQAHACAVIYSIIVDSFLLCCDISRLFLNRNRRKVIYPLSYLAPISFIIHGRERPFELYYNIC